MNSVKYNGNIEATGFCIPNKTSSDILIADGTTLDTSSLLSDYYTKDEADALHTSVIKIKGTLGGKEGSILTLPNDAEVGDAYIVDSDAESSYGEHSVEFGDIFVYVKRGDSGYWTVIQSNWTASLGSSNLSWGSNTTLATVGGININAKLPTNPVDDLEIGIRNLWAKKYMMDWNDTYAGIATKGNDEYGEYYDIYEHRLYAYIGNSGSYNDILQNKVSFESEKQYVLQVKWRNLQKTISDGSVAHGLYLRFNYSDGTRSNWIICLPNHIAPTTLTLVSAKGKTVTGVSCTFGASPNTRIYEIQLVQATKQPNDWMVAPEDIDAAIDAKQDKITGANQNILYIGTDCVTSSDKLKYNASTATLSANKINITRTDDWTNDELKPLTTQSIVIGTNASETNNLLFTRAAVQAGTGTTTPGTYNSNTLYLNPQGGTIRIGEHTELAEDTTNNTTIIRHPTDFTNGSGVFDFKNNCFRRNANSVEMTLGSKTVKWFDVYTEKINGYTINSSVPSGALFTDTNYYPTAFSWIAGTTAGPTGTLSGEGMSNVSIGAIPTATGTQSGVVTTNVQTFAGVKTFNSKINIPAGTDTGIWSGSAFLLGVSSSDSSHAGCTSGNIVVGDPTKKLVLRGTDISFYDGDAKKSRSFIFEDSTKWDNYLSLSGGTMTGAINFPLGITSLITLNGGDLFKLDATDSLKIQVGNSTLPVGVSQLISTDSVITPKIKSGAGAELSFGTNTITSSNSTITATAFFESSDIRKKDIKSDISLDKCYDLIDKCQTIIYSLKSESKEQIGMIAQEVEEFFPEVVATDEEGFKSLAYDRLVVICFKVLKDVIKRLEKLENE